MQPISIEALARIIGGTVTGRPNQAEAGAQASRVTGVSTDSRTIQPGDCFFALPGENFDGHDYVPQVLSKGATCAVVSRNVDGAMGPLLRVHDTIQALGDLAHEYRRMNKFKVVAITGSVGKTTTRQIVHHVLSRRFRTHQAQKSFNNNIGLPLTLLGAPQDSEVIIAEIGANHPGEIAPLTRIALPDIAVVTNAHPAHLEGFGDLATIIREKLSIAEGLSETGAFLINGDIEPLVAAARGLTTLSGEGVPPLCPAGILPMNHGLEAHATKDQGQDALATRGRLFKTFGTSSNVDYRATRIACSGTSSTFAIRGTQVHLPLPGPGNVENAVAAWAVCDQFGLTADDFAKAVEDLSAVSMRAETLQIGSLTVLNDCYNANPASMRNALAMLANLRSCSDPNRNRRLVFICGRMAELGQQAQALHAELGAAVAEAGVDLLVAVGEEPKTTAQVARETSQRDLQTICFDDTQSVCDHVQDFLREDDIILVKGSRTARLERVVQELTEIYG
ncbi:MAG: UDP-N-acetylmuramoyl-tripeptide--D-alanyl-D-alanine ligase [Phycisphaerales bacterium]